MKIFLKYICLLYQPEEQPSRDETLISLAGRLVHDVQVGRVEAERGGGQAVRHQVDPQQLHGDQGLGQAQGRRQEDGHHLTDVGRDQSLGK